jgi:protein-S-isoprenylcysteine O-methyltransferase Ste14
MIETLRHICLALFGLIVMLFADAPFKTVGQRYIAQRSRERFILLTFEVDLVVFWAIGVFWLHWDRGLLPRGYESSLAALGTLVVLAGATLAAWAKLRLGRWFTGTFGVKEGHELVSDGPYGITRHPIYTGLLLMLLGAAFAWDSALTLLLALLLVVPFLFHTVYEEALFERHFGEAYRDYQRRVPRLVPFARWGRRSG